MCLHNKWNWNGFSLLEYVSSAEHSCWMGNSRGTAFQIISLLISSHSRLFICNGGKYNSELFSIEYANAIKEQDDASNCRYFILIPFNRLTYNKYAFIQFRNSHKFFFHSNTLNDCIGISLKALSIWICSRLFSDCK